MVCLSLGTYVIVKNRHLASSRLFAALSSIAAAAALLDFLIITAPDASAAMLFARPLIVLTTVMAAIMLYMTSYLPYEREGSWLVRHRWGFATIIGLAALTAASSGITVAEDRYGWWIVTDASSSWWYATVYILYLSGVAVLVWMYRLERRGDARRQIAPLAAGMAAPLLSAGVVIFITSNGHVAAPALSPTVLASSLCFGYAIVRQRLFALRPVREEVRPFGGVPSARAGQGILVEAKGSDLAYRMFISELASGGQGLVITRMHPDLVRERYGLRSTPVLWLTTKPGPDSLDPSGLTLLLHTAAGFLLGGNGLVVLLDGLEYLEAYNRPEAVMQLIYGLRDAVVMSGSKLIVAVDPDALGQWGLPRLERELEPIQP